MTPRRRLAALSLCLFPLVAGCTGRTERRELPISPEAPPSVVSPGASSAATPAPSAGGPPAGGGTVVFTGRCDASAVAFAPDGKHIVVASDEASEPGGQNQLAAYSLNGEAGPVFDLNTDLGVKEGKEADLEGAASIGRTVYWIASHSRNKEGKERPQRQQFFATTFKAGADGGVTGYEPVGRPYHDLLRDIAADSKVAAVLGDAAAKSPEVEGGLNIEGMAATPEGHLLVAFRNPVPGGKALLVPLTNPGDVVTKGAKAALGAPILLDLSEGGKYADRGVRDVVYSSERGGYLVLAGSWRGYDDPGAAPFALFSWSGKPGDAPKRLGVDLSGLVPEAVAVPPGEKGRALILSDDGNVDGCKDKPDSGRRFRAVWRDLP